MHELFHASIMPTDASKYLTLSELAHLIRTRIDEAHPLPYWVTAEISEMKVNYSGHCYLELVEKGGKNHVPRAKVSAVMWRSVYGAIASYFETATGTPLAVGMQVLVRASVSFHELYGLSLQIVDIDPTYTLGDMERQRRETIARLQEEGVYDMNRELELPMVVQRIAVVSSRNAAGYRDFVQELARSVYRFEVTLFDAFMQGHEAEASIVEALDRIGERCDEFDVVVLIRGGGSQSDLGCFDSYRLCNHVAQFPLPVVTGIGHDKDQSVADLVAYASLKTPTAVAGWLVEGMEETDRYLDTLSQQLDEYVETLFDQERERLQTSGFRLMQMASQLTHRLELKLERLSDTLIHRAQDLLRTRSGQVEQCDKILHERVPALLSRCATWLEMARERVDARCPDRILALGFSIVRVADGAVTDSRMLNPGDRVEITMRHGRAQATINSTDNGKK